VAEAWSVYQHIALVVFIFDFTICNIAYLFRDHLTLIFTNSPEILKLSEKAMAIMIIFHGLDFIQGTLLGTMKALNLQNLAMLINAVTYYVFMVPLAYYFTFKREMGVTGIWVGFALGILHQICAYLLAIHRTDW
jgi:multidrug resistance protein, MATE family